MNQPSRTDKSPDGHVRTETEAAAASLVLIRIVRTLLELVSLGDAIHVSATPWSRGGGVADAGVTLRFRNDDLGFFAGEIDLVRQPRLLADTPVGPLYRYAVARSSDDDPYEDPVYQETNDPGQAVIETVRGMMVCAFSAPA